MISCKTEKMLNSQSKSPVSSKFSKPPVISSMILSGKQRVHSTFPDTSESIEEFDLKSGVLLLRKIKPSTFSSLGSGSKSGDGWIIEVGDDGSVQGKEG